MTPRIIAAHPLVFADNGRFALQAGPIVYCLEEEDNGANLRDIAVCRNAEFEVEFDEFFGANVIQVKAVRSDINGCNCLYRPVEQMKTQEITAKFIPYFGFANRSDCDMLVWFKLT